MTGYLRHEAHGAADTTAVQFYLILVPVATCLGTLNPPTSWRRSRRIQITRFNLKGGLSLFPEERMSHELASKSSCQLAALPGRTLISWRLAHHLCHVHPGHEYGSGVRAAELDRLHRPDSANHARRAGPNGHWQSDRDDCNSPD